MMTSFYFACTLSFLLALVASVTTATTPYEGDEIFENSILLSRAAVAFAYRQDQTVFRGTNSGHLKLSRYIDDNEGNTVKKKVKIRGAKGTKADRKKKGAPKASESLRRK
ncbi:hypothetical protein IV203_023399 [Nitzschia inconspicua]|uniref:Uncharacterized protein n=1 Tax=Nitzschia inconspicua TaxID=303405 RepID=A0A9K3KCZ0_9STRA|nr:hypothetical protein IV203_023399 [Nitzschia inconspicua]